MYAQNDGNFTISSKMVRPLINEDLPIYLPTNKFTQLYSLLLIFIQNGKIK